MSDIIIKGRSVSKGKAEGEALVSQMPIGFMSMVNADTGVVQAKGHDLEGKSVAGKILVFPMYRGSSADPYSWLELVRCKTAPKGVINIHAINISAIGAVLGNIPMIDNPDGNPLELIKSGDYVELDADKGIARVKSRSKASSKDYPGVPNIE